MKKILVFIAALIAGLALAYEIPLPYPATLSVQAVAVEVTDFTAVPQRQTDGTWTWNIGGVRLLGTNGSSVMVDPSVFNGDRLSINDADLDAVAPLFGYADHGSVPVSNMSAIVTWTLLKDIGTNLNFNGEVLTNWVWGVWSNITETLQ